MCSVSGKLVVGESFNMDSQDSDILFSFEDENFVFDRKKNKKRHAHEEDICFPACDFLTDSNLQSFEEDIVEKIDASMVHHRSSIELDIEEMDHPEDLETEIKVTTVIPVKRLKKRNRHESTIIHIPEVHSFAKEPAHNNGAHVEHREEKFFWKEKVHERIRRMRKMSLMDRFVF